MRRCTQKVSTWEKIQLLAALAEGGYERIEIAGGYCGIGLFGGYQYLSKYVRGRRVRVAKGLFWNKKI